ncbi:AfsA-related hotdog domain-containing protein [Streptomyces sp. NPDC060184]|uniref:AfsA-related hotdog domain-containing protein n=1 Tax=Streptomyces sp. NPDC060184 TaxID=3347064 RepID=UPI003657A067
MSSAPAVVVGDRFEEFLTNRGALAASAVLADLEAGHLDAATVLVPGQGLTRDQRVRLSALSGNDVPLPVDRHLTHKRVDKNVLVGPVEPTDDGHYRAPLLLDERVEVLEDHLTGQHIPAVTLLEAARQAWTVVAEQHLLVGEEPTRFVIGAIRSAFHSFVFPLPATIEYRPLADLEGPAGRSLEALLVILQNGRAAAEFEVRLHIVPEPLARRQESMAARQAVRDTLAAVAPPVAAVAR